jgi:hypothetical protein
MTTKISTIAIAVCFCFFTACGGKQQPKEGNDTVAKADATKDTLGVDTNKSAGKDSIGIKKDTVKQGKPKT